MPNKVEKVRALFRAGQLVECVENTYIPKHNGTRRRVVKVGKTVVDGEQVDGEKAGQPFRMTLPSRVRDVLAVDDRQATYLIDESLERLRGHTVTIRRLDPDSEQPADERTDQDG
jgi:hypothetical protein